MSPPPENVPDGYETIPVGGRVTETCMVYLPGGWVNYAKPPRDNVVRGNGEDFGWLPYGYYCRPIKEKPNA